MEELSWYSRANHRKVEELAVISFCVILVTERLELSVDVPVNEDDE